MSMRRLRSLRGRGDCVWRARSLDSAGKVLQSGGRVAWVVVTLVGTAAVLNAQRSDTFRYERTVNVTAPGPHRLAVDVPLLAGASRVRVDGRVARNGLADLRLFDRNGAAVQHLLVQAPSREPLWTGADILPLAITEKTSGFEADFGFTQDVDGMTVEGLPVPFLKRLTLEGSGDRERWTVLAQEGTLFDLPRERLRQTEISFAPGPYRYLRVTWNDTNSGRMPLPRVVRARRVIPAAPPAPLTAAVTYIKRPSEPGVSRYRLVLPGAGLPITTIELAVRSGHVFRTAAVFESRIAGGQAVPAEIGSASLKRVEQDGAAAGDLRIPIESPAEPELELVINDGSNPPLDLAGVTARFAELPWIYFEAPAGTVTARYGNPMAVAPSYDLEAMRESIDLAKLPTATWGEPRRLDLSTAVETPAPPPAAGGMLDTGAFRYSRAIADGDVGLAALVLDAAVLSQSRGPGARFADVRIVDTSGRQIPYLIERRDEPLSMELGIRPDTAPSAAADRTRHQSVYRVTLPYSRLDGGRIVVETSGRVFRRQVQVAVERPADRRNRGPWLDVVAESGWTHSQQESAAHPLLLSLGRTEGSELVLTVDEGDNAPLPITGVRLLLPSYRLRFYRPSTSPLRLLYGRDDLTPPQYDLALLGPQVMGAEAKETTAALPVDTPSPSGATFVSPRMFWVVLGGAVLILLGLIARLVVRPVQ